MILACSARTLAKKIVIVGKWITFSREKRSFPEGHKNVCVKFDCRLLHTMSVSSLETSEQLITIIIFHCNNICVHVKSRQLAINNATGIPFSICEKGVELVLIPVV